MLEGSNKAVLAVLAIVVISAGCVQSSSTDLKSDFDIQYEETDFNRSGNEIYQDSISQIDSSNEYAAESDSKMVMNIPVVSFSTNMTSKASFREESSEVNSTGRIRFNFGSNSNTTEFSTQITTSENSTVVSREVRRQENRTEEDRYNREELKVSLEALKGIKVENATALGITQLNGEENIVMELDLNSSDLMRHSARLFETNSPIKESVGGEQELEEESEFSEVNAYMWAERQGLPSKFAYYGSANNSSLQIRSVTQYSRR